MIRPYALCAKRGGWWSGRDKTSLDIFWIRDESLADLDNLPDPDVLAEEIIENLEAGVANFKQVMQSLNGR